MTHRARMLAICFAGGLAWFAPPGCSVLRQPYELPTANSLVLQQLVVHSDFPLSREHRLLSELEALRGHLTAELDLPQSNEPVHIYLFQTERQYRKFMHERFPDLPDRRAFFVENDGKLTVYAQWGDRMAEDLRHEVSHGYLHAVVPNLPLWVDEGLAVYFEVPRELQGCKRSHVELLLTRWKRGTWRPDLARLARIDTPQQMHQIDYAESWAWIHLLLHSQPENRALLQHYLASLHQRRNPVPLDESILRAQPDATRILLAHLEELAANSGP